MTSAVELEYSDVWEFESVNWTVGTAGLGALAPWQTAGLALLAAGVSLVTICGNLIVLLSFMLERSIRQPSNYFIASLAVSDLLIGRLIDLLFHNVSSSVKPASLMAVENSFLQSMSHVTFFNIFYLNLLFYHVASKFICFCIVHI